jgi:type II secretory pathway component PulF
MEKLLSLGFFTMAGKITAALEKPFPYIVTAAVIAAIWIYFLFLIPRKTKRYNSFADYMNDLLNFRVSLMAVVAKILYIAFSIVIFIVGVVAIFVANFFVGILGMLILELILRLFFEAIMVLFSLQENMVILNDRLDDHAREDD